VSLWVVLIGHRDVIEQREPTSCAVLHSSLSLSLSVAMLEHSGRNSLESARAAPKLQYIRSPSTSNFRGILPLQITAAVHALR
jgi:hypothetical protein